MAIFKAEGVGDLTLSIQEAAEIPEDIQTDILQAQAAQTIDKIQQLGRQYGVYRTGDTLRSLKAGRVKRNKEGDLSLLVSFVGKNKRGTRFAEIAFVNNFGKRGQAARPFFTDGVAAMSKPNAETARRIFDDWLKSHDL